METSEKIELYLEGKLDPIAKAALETEIAQNPALSEEVEIYRDIIRGVQLGGENDFMHKIHAWEKELSAKDIIEEKHLVPSNSTEAANVKPLHTQTKSNENWMKIAVAACLLAVLSVGIWQFTQPDSNPKDLFEKYNSPYSTEGITDRAGNDDFVKATRFFEKKEYAEAVKLYDGILDTHPDSVIVNLYAGIANVSLGKAKEATEQLEKVIASNNPNYKEAAEWYLAILPLQAGDKNAAIARLEAIRNTSGHEYREKAKELLKELR
jgi:tetratricopeptide (TPR) repeat protein